MNWTCIIANFSGKRAVADWRVALKHMEFPMNVEYYTRAESVCERLQNPGVGAMVVFADENTGSVETVLDAFQKFVGCLPDNQAVISDDPGPVLMAHLFEYGVEKIFSTDSWVTDTSAFIRSIVVELDDPESLESKIMNLTSALQGSPVEIDEALVELGEMAEYDFRAAQAQGHALIQNDHLGQAADAFEKAKEMNKMFKPAARNFGELLLGFGRYNEALELFEKLNAQNPESINHKANLVKGYLATQDLDKARYYAGEAMKIDPESRPAIEAAAQVMIKSGQVQEAIEILGKVGNVSPHMVGIFNKTGIGFSKKGDLDSALDFFRKAHKLCSPADCYKISINAAIACLGMNQPEVSLDFLKRCEREYGSVFPKLSKVRKVAEISIKKKKLAARNKTAA